MPPEKEVFNFSELFPVNYQAHEMPPLEPYQARDGATLMFRRYGAESNIHVILLHGSSAHSAYLYPFAHHLSRQHVANVYTPDLRGHGPHPLRRGDVDYIGQLEHDVADLITHIKAQAGETARIVIGGHSSGGGLALRFASGEYGKSVSQLILIAPYLGHNVPMVKQDAGGWAIPNLPKIIAISALNALGIKMLNGTKVLSFKLPTAYRNGSETLEYSYRLMKGMHPVNYKECLMRTTAPLLVMIGTADESLVASEFESGILLFKQDVKIAYFNGVSHLGIVLSEPAMTEAASWIKEYDDVPQ